MRAPAVVLAVALAAACARGGDRTAAGAGPPPLVIGRFADDYGNAFRISPALFEQLPRNRFHIVEWNAAEQYFLARNDAGNSSDSGLWTRVDWMPLTGMEPYTWGFCMTAYRAPTLDSARATTPAVRSVPRRGCAGFPFSRMRVQPVDAGPDTAAMFAMAQALAADSLRGRGPWTPENEHVARYLAARLTALGARPAIGGSILVPFASPPRPADTVYNVVGVLPARGGSVGGQRVGLTAHFDHLGVAAPDERGDSIYNGFLDAALPVAMVLDVARRYAAAPGTKPLVVAFFNLEEQGLLGSLALAGSRPRPLGELAVLIGVDAGSPAGEAVTWQLMGGAPEHAAARIADSLARARGWTTTSTPPRAISDVFPFSQLGVPILFPIPGRTWRGYTDAQRSDAMARFDHYHKPADEARRDFPLTGTWYFADWLWSIVSVVSR